MTNTYSLQTRNGAFRVAVDGLADGPVLLFSNSLGTTLEMWEGQLAAFGSTHRVVGYDSRGHGGSPAPAGPYSFNQLGADVLGIMDALGIERAFFCGISMGGHTGLWLGVHAPERFAGIAVCNSAAKIGTGQAWEERAGMVRQGGVAAMKEMAASAPQRWFTPDFVQARPDVVAAAQDMIAGIDPEGYAACCDALGLSDLRPEQGRITVPTLLLAGESDPVTTVADAQAMHEAIAGSSLASVPASHLSNLEAPQAFNQALARFISPLA
ncbi:3-oxoadipate enol-lactonase [Pusillimonas sp. MFBS29]|uniref:3-oxoadipate enol-lactonase n=1 Tax=Pusillimonas sp. MFBS29 TaxID=2886690 RepID=UPI001D10E131|nr:3-oxoadipate enol-lactonase [Pusillimonas sp. MFBS29]MCC2596031.1 3-oxoadipate enol-lactonase [Pusillimonas sp. MFBS29]